MSNFRRLPPGPPSATRTPRTLQGGARESGQVRIIGGRLRGSRLPVPAVAGLRPSSDRMRETLFNWLMHELGGAQCLDLFAGSGALGFEAASRGAARVQLIDREPVAASSLGASAQRLGVSIAVECADALTWLRRAPDQLFDIVFVDPPFAAGLLDEALSLLPPHLSARAWIYIEAAPGGVPRLPAPWRLHRELATRNAHGRLYRQVSDEPA